MSSDQSPHHPSFNDDDIIDDDDDDNTSFNAPTPDTSSSDTDTTTTTTTTNNNLPLITITPTPTAVTIAIPSTTVPTTATATSTATAIATASITLPKKKPPVGLFQRLWTDEDEIELLQGFLDYTTSRGTAGSSHHHDTAAFYDQIKSKLQLDFNKNQLVEKLRRLKKKYRTALSKMSSGKDFAFKSSHDQTTFEISSKIWSSLKSGSKQPVVEYDEDEPNPNPNPNPNYTPEMSSGGSGSGGYYISQINLNTPISDHNKAGYTSVGGGTHVKLSTRKRPRVDKIESVRNDGVGVGVGVGVDFNMNNVNVDGGGDNNHNGSTNVYGGGLGGSGIIQGVIEDTVRSTLSPMFKELVNNAVNGSGYGGGKRGMGVEELGLNAIPLNFPRVNSSEVVDEKWRKQQILELQVYSKRLELVQDQIKLTLEELRSMSGVND